MKTNSTKVSREKLAFTLVELLTVIAIIGILAAMLMTGIPAAIKAAKIKKAKLEISAIVTAITGYEADYSRFPVTQPEQTAAGSADFTTGLVNGFGTGAGVNGYSFDNNNQVIATLMDMEKFPNGVITSNNAHVKNAKKFLYLNAKISGYDPATNDPNPPGGVDNSGIYRDPWGNPYIITMDLSGDQQSSDILYSLRSVSQNPPASSSQAGFNGLSNPVDANGAGDHYYFHGSIMVWSAGPDKKYDTGSANTGVNKDNVLSWQ